MIHQVWMGKDEHESPHAYRNMKPGVVMLANLNFCSIHTETASRTYQTPCTCSLTPTSSMNSTTLGNQSRRTVRSRWLAHLRSPTPASAYFSMSVVIFRVHRDLTASSTPNNTSHRRAKTASSYPKSCRHSLLKPFSLDDSSTFTLTLIIRPRGSSPVSSVIIAAVRTSIAHNYSSDKSCHDLDRFTTLRT
jgi:hypothetical protein